MCALWQTIFFSIRQSGKRNAHAFRYAKNLPIHPPFAALREILFVFNPKTSDRNTHAFHSNGVFLCDLGSILRRTLLRFCRALDSIARQLVNVPILQFFPRPRILAQKRETGADCRIEHEAADLNLLRQRIPSVQIHHRPQHHFQRDAVKGIFRVGWRISHIHMKVLERPSCVNHALSTQTERFHDREDDLPVDDRPGRKQSHRQSPSSGPCRKRLIQRLATTSWMIQAASAIRKALVCPSLSYHPRPNP